MLNGNGESDHGCPILNFKGNDFGFSPLSMMLTVSLLYIAFIMLRNLPFIPNFFRALIMKGC
jgi:hypothetical protein